MKKLISILLVIAMMAAFAACGNKTNEAEELPQNAVVDTDKTDAEESDNKTDDKKEPELSADPAIPNESKPSAKPTENKPAENKPAANPNKPAESKPAENNPADIPAEKPVEKPAENKPAAPATLGNKLLAAFNSNASSKSGEELANAILSIPEIEFSPVVMSVEEGLLTGFGNTEIKGFKSGTVFAPMIGSIPFVGYIFELENASDASGFISTLRANANLRWNVCTEADEMITGSNGNKVFFVMCPTDFDEE